MRLTVLAALALLSIGGCSVAEPVDAAARPPLVSTDVVAEPPPQSTDDRPQPCPVLVRFGSFAMGIDGPAAQAVEAALRADPRAGEITSRPWGREGESDLCVAAATKADARALAETARAAIPNRALRGPISILLYGRTVFPAAGG